MDKNAAALRIQSDQPIWPQQSFVGLQNIAHRLAKRKLTRPLARLIVLLIRLVYSATLPAEAKIHRSVHFGHSALAVVLNAGVVVEEGGMIGSHVVLGGRSPLRGAPHIKPYVTIHAGAKVIGPITVGEGSIVGANAVVVQDVPPFSVVAGVPAKVISENIDPADYWPRAVGSTNND